MATEQFNHSQTQTWNVASQTPYYVESLQRKFICVIDPHSRKLEIPSQFLHDTYALNRVGIPSLCMLYLDGRCKAGLLCHQAHVDLNIVQQLRNEALSKPTCCHQHGDFHSSNIQQIIGEHRIWINQSQLDFWAFATTLGLLRLIRESTSQDIVLTPRFVCRLHLANRCRYVEECNHIHICRNMSDIVKNNIKDFKMPHVYHNSIYSSQNICSSLSPGEISEIGTPPESPIQNNKSNNRWCHAPYHWRLLDEYEYISDAEQNEMAQLSGVLSLRHS